MPSTIWSGSRDDILPTLRRAFLIGASAVVAVAITVAWLYWANLKSSESVIESQRIGRIARDSRALATDRESAVRSYLLSNGQLSLAPDAESATQLKAKIDSLISLTADEPAQLERATDIRGAINRWERGWLTPALAGQSTSGIGITVAQDAAGTELFDSIRAAFDRFGAEQQRGFSKVVNGQVRLQKITLVAAAIEVMLLLAVLSWLSSTALAQAKRLIEQADQLQKQTADLGRHAKELEVETIQHRKLEDQLLQSQKMEAVGRLAGGVAHDFNNMLTAILSYGEMLLADLPDQSPQRADVTEIVKAAEKATALTR